MNINNQGLDLIKSFEGLELETYIDPVGIPTIGYGHIEDVKTGMVISEGEAENLLRQDVSRFEDAVRRLVKTDLNENEFSALVSLAFNIGEAAFARSTVLERLNRNERLGAAEAIEWWNKGRINGELKTLRGLARRRSAEKALFLKAPDEQVVRMPLISLEENTRLPPSRESSNRREDLNDSRTLQGAGVAATTGGGAAAVTAADKSMEGVEQQSPQVERFFQLVDMLPHWFYWLLAALTIAALLYVMWARVDDWRSHRR